MEIIPVPGGRQVRHRKILNLEKELHIAPVLGMRIRLMGGMPHEGVFDIDIHNFFVLVYDKPPHWRKAPSGSTQDYPSGMMTGRIILQLVIVDISDNIPVPAVFSEISTRFAVL